MSRIKLVQDEETQPYVLSNGKIIDSLTISEKMRRIADRKPEEGSIISGTGYAWNEVGMAQLFAECYLDDTRYCPEAKSWYTYDKGAWRKDVGALLVSAKVKEFYQLLALYSGEIENEDRRTAFLKLVVKLGDRRFRDRLLKDASDNELLTIAGKDFDADPYLINCKNGTYSLKTMTFKEHDWHDLLTMQTNFDYTLADVTCERWERFVDEVTEGDKEKADYLQRALGYSMLGTANEECMFILHGKTTRNGKSTMLSAIHHLLGDYASVAPVSIICKGSRERDGEAPSPVLASLKGRRFVTMAENNQYGKLDEEIIKQITGGEEITARHLHEKPITFLPQFTLWLSCNDLPYVSDKSLFASDRLKVIEFNRHFSAEEQDKNLKNVFQSNAAMQGIFSWMVRGYFKYKRFGLGMPPSMKKVVNAYKRENDLVLQFLEERCEKSEEDYVLAKSLYDSYKIWCKSNGFFIGSAKKFNAEMQTHPEWHHGKGTKNGYAVYNGIKLKGT